jgi:hypothetical protein
MLQTFKFHFMLIELWFNYIVYKMLSKSPQTWFQSIKSPNLLWSVITRETRKGWPLQTVETDANGDSECTYDRGPALVGSLGSSCRYKRFLSWAALIGQLENIIPHTYSISFYLSPFPSNLGRLSCRLAWFLICVFGYYTARFTVWLCKTH